MATLRSTPDEVIREAAVSTAQRIPGDFNPAAVERAQNIRGYNDFVRSLEKEGNVPSDIAHAAATSTIAATLERSGVNPSEWFSLLPKAETEKIKYGPDELEEARKFFGSWTKVGAISLLIATILGIVVAVTGTGLAAAAAGAAGRLLLAGRGLSAVKTLLQIRTLVAIKWLSVPAILGYLAQQYAQFSNVQLSSTGDVLTYLKQGVARGEQLSGGSTASTGGGGSRASTVSSPKTIIRMVEDRKPEQFIGTLFSAKLGRVESFERKVDDKITDMDDLREDVKINLNRWLRSLPNRLGYSVVVRKNPVDEVGTKQSGIWATLTIFMQHLSGKLTPIDTILLGPVDPQVRLELTRHQKTIESEISGFIDAAEVREIGVPGGTVDIFTPDGERTTVSGKLPTPKETPFATHTKTSDDVAFEQETERIARGVESVEDQVRRVEEERKTTPQVSPPGQTTEPAVQVWPNQTLGGFIPEIGVRTNQIVLTDTPDSVLNLRSCAGLGCAVMAKLPHESRVAPTGQIRKGDGHTWAQVHTNAGIDLSDSWVASHFLKAI